MKDLYKTLDVDEKATQKEIKAAFRKKSKKYHPDINKETGDEIVAVNKAYAVLGDNQRRIEYDKTGNVNKHDENNEALTRICKKFIEMIDSSLDFSKINIIKHIEDFLTEDNRKKNNLIEKAKIYRKEIEKVYNRIEIKKSSNNIFKNILQERLNLIDHDIGKIEKEKAIIKKSKLILKNYSDNITQENSYHEFSLFNACLSHDTNPPISTW